MCIRDRSGCAELGGSGKTGLSASTTAGLGRKGRPVLHDLLLLPVARPWLVAVLLVAAGSPPTPTVGHGAVTSIAVADRASGFGSYRAEVYLPPQYLAEPTRRFPVLYLLHGSPGVPVDWLRGGRYTSAL